MLYRRAAETKQVVETGGGIRGADDDDGFSDEAEGISQRQPQIALTIGKFFNFNLPRLKMGFMTNLLP